MKNAENIQQTWRVRVRDITKHAHLTIHSEILSERAQNTFYTALFAYTNIYTFNKEEEEEKKH